MFWKTRKFKDLSTEWNKKLQDSGFLDIEEKSGALVKEKGIGTFKRKDNFEIQSRLEYYNLIGHLVQNTIFPNKIEEIIMNCHAEGMPFKEIIQELQRMGLTRERRRIRFIIKRWKQNWGIQTPLQTYRRRVIK